MKFLPYAVLLSFICASGLQNYTAPKFTPPQHIHEWYFTSWHTASFPKGKFWSNNIWELDIWLRLLDIWPAQGSAPDLRAIQRTHRLTAHSAPEPVQKHWIYCASARQIHMNVMIWHVPKASYSQHMCWPYVLCDSGTSAPWKGQVYYKWAIQHMYRSTWTQQPQPSSLPSPHSKLQVSQRDVLVIAKRAILLSSVTQRNDRKLQSLNPWGTGSSHQRVNLTVISFASGTRLASHFCIYNRPRPASNPPCSPEQGASSSTS